MTLFLDRGFDAVTTTQVAAAAGVSPATLFNYFATKEDLFFGQVDELEAALVEVVASCPVGESLMDALRDHVMYELTAGRAYTDPAAVAPFHHQVAHSQQLQAREAELYQRRELVLAAALTDALDCRKNPIAGPNRGRPVHRRRATHRRRTAATTDPLEPPPSPQKTRPVHRHRLRLHPRRHRRLAGGHPAPAESTRRIQRSVGSGGRPSGDRLNDVEPLSELRIRHRPLDTIDGLGAGSCMTNNPIAAAFARVR